MQPGGAQAPAPSPFEPGEIKVGDENLVRPWENAARYKIYDAAGLPTIAELLESGDEKHGTSSGKGA
jgi:hypothetical protein